MPADLYDGPLYEMPVVGTKGGGVLTLGDGEGTAGSLTETRTMTGNSVSLLLRNPEFTVEVWLPVDNLRAAREAGHVNQSTISFRTDGNTL